eukprot:gene2580-2882_t
MAQALVLFASGGSSLEQGAAALCCFVLIERYGSGIAGPLNSDWQHPFVNVFKLCDVEQRRNVEVAGKVVQRMDDVIHRKVYQISGTIPAVNFVKVPKAKPLNLTGRFCYLQAQLVVSQVTDFNVRVLRFSPFEPDHFVTAGRDSVRCYRLKTGRLRGISVQMQ